MSRRRAGRGAANNQIGTSLGGAARSSTRPVRALLLMHRSPLRPYLPVGTYARRRSASVRRDIDAVTSDFESPASKRQACRKDHLKAFPGCEAQPAGVGTYLSTYLPVDLERCCIGPSGT
ncbi:hypothetical protein PMIN06_011443 [Paraphaeosphaeria minitans]